MKTNIALIAALIAAAFNATSANAEIRVMRGEKDGFEFFVKDDGKAITKVNTTKQCHVDAQGLRKILRSGKRYPGIKIETQQALENLRRKWILAINDPKISDDKLVTLLAAALQKEEVQNGNRAAAEFSSSRSVYIKTRLSVDGVVDPIMVHQDVSRKNFSMRRGTVGAGIGAVAEVGCNKTFNFPEKPSKGEGELDVKNLDARAITTFNNISGYLPIATVKYTHVSDLRPLKNGEHRVIPQVSCDLREGNAPVQAAFAGTSPFAPENLDRLIETLARLGDVASVGLLQTGRSLAVKRVSPTIFEGIYQDARPWIENKRSRLVSVGIRQAPDFIRNIIPPNVGVEVNLVNLKLSEQDTTQFDYDIRPIFIFDPSKNSNIVFSPGKTAEKIFKIVAQSCAPKEMILQYLLNEKKKMN